MMTHIAIITELKIIAPLEVFSKLSGHNKTIRGKNMKNLMSITLLSVLVFLNAKAASAMPSVGDWVRYDGIYSAHAFTLEQTLTEYDTSAQKFKLVETVDFGQGPKTTESWKALNELASTDMVEYVLAHCAEQKGTLERVSVKAGSFDTCKLPTDDGKGTINAAPVPFAIVKAHIIDAKTGQPVDLELSSYKNGQ